jgi:hypothetical protein
VTKAINGPLDMGNFVSLDTDAVSKNEMDFDKDIDQILKEIESDTDFTVDEKEIENILHEIEQDSEAIKPQFKPDLRAVEDLKNKFKKQK